MTWPPAPWTAQDGGGKLAGLRVLDLSNFLPGPFCTQMLADLGADVLKVEPPSGDPARHLPDGMYLVANRNKRSITLDLKQADHQDALRRLAAEADVFVEGFRPGVAERLGAGYEALSRLAPGLVYCSVSGYGQQGPARDKGGHDLTFLAASGALSVSPQWGQAPHRSGVPIADLAASSYAAVAILTALRERDRTGQGCHLDVAIAESSLAFISPRCGPDFGSDPTLAAYPSNDIFATADGRSLAVAAVEEKFWSALTRVLGRVDERVADARFGTPQGRRDHGDELSALLKSIFARQTLAEWLAVFQGVDVPVEPVLTAAEAARSPQVRQRGVVQSCEGEEQIVFPVLENGVPLGRFRARAPKPGQHTDQFLAAFATVET